MPELFRVLNAPAMLADVLASAWQSPVGCKNSQHHHGHR